MSLQLGIPGGVLSSGAASDSPAEAMLANFNRVVQRLHGDRRNVA